MGLISPNFLVLSGQMLTGASTVLFGLLDHVPAGAPYLASAYVIRILEGVGAAAFMTSSYSVMAAEFPDSVATAFSLLGTAFGLGLITGPTVGGALYEVGGYLLPFVMLGAFLLIGSLLGACFMPRTGETKVEKSGQLIKFMTNGGVLIDSLSILTSLLFIGFNAATLEPHLRKFELSPLVMGFIFIITGGIYAVTAPVWGRFFDAGYEPKMFILFGCALDAVGFALLGPLPIVPYRTSLLLVIIALVFIGVGHSAKLVAAPVDALKDAIGKRGFPDDMSTYGLVSAMYFTSNSIGYVLIAS